MKPGTLRARAGVRVRGSIVVAALVSAALLAPTPATAAKRAPRAAPAAQPAPRQLPGEGFNVVIRRASHGIPHIIARDYASLGYGYGYAFASDDICTIADSYVTVRGERSRFFGPDQGYKFEGNGSTANNLNSDFFFQRIIDNHTIEKLMAAPVPDGPQPEIRDIVRGYTAGYNRYLADTGVDKLPDPTCRGKPWVRPLTEIDVYRRFYQLALLASAGVAIDGIGSAAPLVPGVGDASATFSDLAGKLPLGGGLGSNAIALGKDATDNGKGMLLGNPHFPWQGSERFYQSHLTVPGKLDVEGASLFGVPLILIGHTPSLAWSHTVSTAFRFTPFEEKLVPGSPTSYVSDGQVKQMRADHVTVKALTADGSLQDRTRTLYSTDHGPMFTSILGLPLFPWTVTSGFAMGDANAGNFRYLNHFFDTNRATSVRELDGIERRDQGIPWVNTLAADSTGKAYYADIGVVPNVPDSKVSQCNTAVGLATSAALGLPTLDGSRSACDWGNDADAVQPGTFGPSHLPSLFRDDYVTNSNDSYWLSNPKQPLEGFARIIGPERTARSLRTRLGLVMVAQRLAGADGLAGNRFSLGDLQDLVFNDRQYAGELFRDQLVAMCRANPTLPGSSGPVDVSAACPVLAAWDLHDNLDSRGAVLFRRFATRALASAASVLPPPATFAQPFDVADPVNTPRGLNTSSPTVKQALADAVAELRQLGIPLDARLRDYQFEPRGAERIPIHGGPGTLGVFNAINAPFAGASGFPDVVHGSSFVQAVQFTSGCPRVRTILTYSQSTNPLSPYYADQTRMFSNKQWVPGLFCDEQLLRDPALQITSLGCIAFPGVTRARVTGGRRRLRVRFQRAVKLPVGVQVFRAGRTGISRRVAHFRRRGGFAFRPRRLSDGVYYVRFDALARSGLRRRSDVAFRVRRGRVRRLRPFSSRARCGALSDVALTAPRLGARSSLTVRAAARSRVSAVVLRGGRAVRRLHGRTVGSGRRARFALGAGRLGAGGYVVRVFARSGRSRTRVSLSAVR